MYIFYKRLSTRAYDHDPRTDRCGLTRIHAAREESRGVAWNRVERHRLTD